MGSRITVTAIIGAALVMLGASCAAATPDACSMLTQLQVSAALGVEVEAGVHLLPHNTAMCSWSEPEPHEKDYKKVVLSLSTTLANPSPVDRYSASKTPEHGGMERATDNRLGDEAFYTSSGSGTTLSVRKGSKSFQLSMHGVPADEAKQKEKMLAEEVLSKL